MRIFLCAALMGLLTACGGGGGGSGTPVIGGPGSGASSPTATDSATINLKLSSPTVTAGAPATVTAAVVNKSGSPVPGVVVKFSTDTGLGAFSASSALTDGSGVASVVMSPANSATAGADTLKATVTYAGSDYSASVGFQLTATNVTISSFTSDVGGATRLSAYGQANLTLVLAGTSSTTPVNVTLTSSCTSAGKASLTPSSVTTSTGRATFTFRDQGCGAVAANENLQVSVAGTSLTQALTIPLSSPQASSIGFVSASPNAIYLKGSGLVESSNVTFKVKDESNNGLPNQTVLLEPSVLVGGLTLDGQTGSVTKVTDSNGDVIVRVNAGTVPTPVRIKATLQGGANISTVSSALAIAVGLPSQLNFSVAQETINIEGYDVQGTPNTYTVIASDRLGNPVPDGTAINFVAEGGQIQAIRQTALDAKGIATATANFATAAPVPVDGRVTAVVYALGEKSFLDVNGNNVYDAGEDFQDLGDIFLDRKYDGYYNPTDDQFISLGNADSKACLAATSPLLGMDVSIPSRPNTCSQVWGRAYVRRALQTIFSTSAARPVWGTARSVYEGRGGGSCVAPIQLIERYVDDQPVRNAYYPVHGSKLFDLPLSGVITFTLADANPVAYNPVAAGSVVSVVATDGITVGLVGGSPVANTSTPTGVAINYKFDATTAGTISINVRSPGGLITTALVAVKLRSTNAPAEAGCN